MGRGILHNRRGFTLAELLISIAILGVLAAIAVPSISAAQKNMQMAELDSAAEQIALAAQSKMTSMKVAGTWLAELELKVPKLSEQAAENVPATILDASNNDLFYLTAQQAKDLKIITSLAIDSSVVNGDLIIEFSKTTATVSGVFFADGKAGFFSDEVKLGGAQAYYNNMNSSTDREQTKRRAASPLVGYYEGTPAGATNAVALRNPNIWVDDEGMLCVENVNETDHPDWNTSVQVTIETKDGSGKFVLGGMQKGGLTYSVALAEEGTSAKSYATDGVYEIVARDENASSPTNVYQIDLNRLLEKLKTEGTPEIQNQLQAFGAGVDIKITAKVKAENRPSVPTTATAFIEWPSKIAKLTILVTGVDESLYTSQQKENDPDYYLTLATTRNGAKKTAFEPVSVVSSEVEELEKPPTLDKAEERFEIINTPQSLKDGTDRGAAAQYFYGKQVAYSSVETDGTMLFRIEPGNTISRSVQNPAQAHYYQIYEIWINNTLVGSVQGTSWQWVIDNEKLELFLEANKTQPIRKNMQTFSKDSKAIYLDQTKLKNLAQYGIDPVDGGYTIYIRTAPTIKEIQQYFGDQNVDPFPVMNPGDIVSARGEGKSKAVRDLFYREFYASSSVALWTAVEGLIEGVPDSKETDIRFYYAPTPFVKVNAAKMVDSPLRSSVLWCLHRQSIWWQPTLYYYAPIFDYIAVGQDYSSASDDFVPGVIKQPEVGGVGSADFAIQPTTDYLYYRSITYYEDENKQAYTDPAPQWVPLLGFNAANGASVTDEGVVLAEKPTNDPTGKKGWRFLGWTLDPAGSGKVYKPGEKVNILPLGNIKLYAKYQEPQKAAAGMMYIETYTDGTQGYYGYADGTQNIENTLSADAYVSDWGYYAVAPEGKEPDIAIGKDLLDFKYDRSIDVPNGRMDAYRLTPKRNDVRLSNVEVAIKRDSQTTYAYHLNLNFAAAVTSDASVAAKWGKSGETSYQVRSSDQLIGYFPIKDFNEKRQFLTAFYRQSTRINMDRAESRVNSSTPFMGGYDGQSLEIINYRPTANYNNSVGLFPATQGATLKNILISDPTSMDPVITGAGEVFNFGILVGSAESTDIENCHIVGKSGTDMSVVSVAPATSGTQNIGALVGVSIGDVTKKGINSCSVENLTLQSLTSLSGWNDVQLNIGLLAGSSRTTPVKDCSVKSSKVYVIAENDLPGPMIAIGSLLGWCTGSKEFTPDSDRGLLVQDIALVSSGIVKNQWVGAIIGFAEKNIPNGQVKDAFNGVTLNDSDVTNPVGNQQ